ncbi:hypothetical protein H0H93_005977 [Arthromyces matolae]|nr:hypothetical protein H0H93_005977 [Arthromyces matolae]
MVQIMASLLYENNQLLRAAGNVTTINAISKSTLSPGSVVNTLKDVWVNGLFFTSLGLSLSTALLTVLVKQWLHAYSSFITGDARHRAFITHLRSEGLRTWRVREIVEALPLILHSSVLIFFIGLVLYVSQLSTPICAVLATITALAFLFYVGTSILPSVFIACPYRILIFFNVCESIAYCIFSLRKYIVYNILLARAFIPTRLWNICFIHKYRWTSKPRRQSLDVAELEAIHDEPPTFDILERLLAISSQRSTEQIVHESVFAILRDCELPLPRQSLSYTESFKPFQHTLIGQTLTFSLFGFALSNESTNEVDGLLESISKTWENRVVSLNERIEVDQKIKIPLYLEAYGSAASNGNLYACECILDWIGKPALEDARNASALLDVMRDSTGYGIQPILKRTTAVLSKPLRNGYTLLHYYAFIGNLDAVKAVVDADGSDEVLNSKNLDGFTPLDMALSKHHDVVSYLMDLGGRASPISYEAAFLWGIRDSKWSIVRLLWRRRKEVRVVNTSPNSWCTQSAIAVASTWRKLDVIEPEESTRRKLLEILQECDEACMEEGVSLNSSQRGPAEEQIPPIHTQNETTPLVRGSTTNSVDSILPFPSA